MKICGLIWRRQPAALAVVVKLAAARREVSVEDLKFEVFEFHEHRLASMNLQRHEPPADLPGIVVDELQRLVAVDPGADVIALRDNGVIVPILIFVVTNREEHLGIGELLEQVLPLLLEPPAKPVLTNRSCSPPSTTSPTFLLK